MDCDEVLEVGYQEELEYERGVGFIRSRYKKVS